MSSETFEAIGLSQAVFAALTAAKFTVPTPIQDLTIPLALKNVDVMGIARTGTGKTLAYALPIIEKLRAGEGRALILVPTRELALQVEQSFRCISDRMRPHLGIVTPIGGTNIRMQIDAIRRNPRIIIATPGRLMDLIARGAINLSDVNTLILDEADRMLDMGFKPQIDRILAAVPRDRQTMLFSATMSPEITTLAEHYMIDPKRVEASVAGTAPETIEQHLCYVDQDRKSEVLETLLQRYNGSVLVFARTRHGADKLCCHLDRIGYDAAQIHSSKTLSQRRRALDGFKAGRYRVLVATDIAARGIDVQDIELVVNYDLPDAPEDYIHRIGRTGRAGKDGLAISFATPKQYMDVHSIERLIDRSLPLSEYSVELAPSARNAQGGAKAPKSGNPFFQRKHESGHYDSRSNRPAPRRGEHLVDVVPAPRPGREPVGAMHAAPDIRWNGQTTPGIGSDNPFHRSGGRPGRGGDVRGARSQSRPGRGAGAPLRPGR
ncbi:MAG: DEAD/DEAH box helicase [Capsulimonadaceae bacterium]|nr:DEAD/DEAH box helicase [Capsulimonadaceae bacterium]